MSEATRAVQTPARRRRRRRGRTGANVFVRVLRDRNGRIGFVIVCLLAVVAILGVTGTLPHDPLANYPDWRMRGPSARFWFGNDQFGRDVAARCAVGVWYSLRVALVSVAMAAVVGSALGISAGFFSGWLDQIVSRIVDIMFAFPAILLAMAVVAALGSGWTNTAFAIAIVYTPIFARVSRAPTLSVRTSEFVKALRVQGIPTWRIMLRHVLPNVSAPIVVQVTLAVSWAILTEASLSFLGLGPKPPAASLGLMVADSSSTVALAWWTLAFPAFFIAIAVIGLNLLGDGLRGALDPRRAGE